MSEQNKLVKMVTDSTVLVGLTAGVGYWRRKFSKKIFSVTRPQTLWIMRNSPVFSRVLWLWKLIWKIRKYFQNLFKMASIAIMLGGAVLNASTFIGGSYLAKYLSGTKTDQERRRHDKAWRDIRGTTPNIRKIGKSYSIGRSKTGMKMRYLHRISKILTRLWNFTISFILKKICKSTNQFFLIITGLLKNRK